MRNFALIMATCLVALVLAAAPTIHADPVSTEAAKTHADRGMMYYNLSDWPAAIREFRAAFEADPRPEYLFSKGQAERHGGDCAAAILSYKAFLRTSRGSSSRVAATEDLIGECEAQLEDARRNKREAARAAATEREAKLHQTPTVYPPPKPVVAAKHSWVSDPAGLILSIAGVSVAAAGTAFFLWGNTEMRSASNQATYQQYESNVSGAKTKRIVGIIGMGAGAGLLSLGIVRYVIVAPQSSREKGVAIRLDVSSAGVCFHGQF